MDPNTITEITDGISDLLGKAGASPAVRALVRPLAERAIAALLETGDLDAKLEKIRRIIAAKDAVLAVFAD